MKKLVKCAFLALAVVLTFEYSYVTAIWIMGGKMAAFDATESMIEAQRHFVFDTVLGYLAK